MARRLSHLDESGRPRMVDITAKADTARQAIAKGSIRMKPQTLALIQAGQVVKGDVLSVAQVAGVMAAKKTHELIPLCHPLLLTDIDVQLEPDEKESALHITASVRTTGKTGVEMEALTAVAVAALTVYDMCKAVDRGMRIEGVRLVRKSGGKSGEIVLEDAAPISAGSTDITLQTGQEISNCEEKVFAFCKKYWFYRAYDLVAVPADDTLDESQVRLANKMRARMEPSVVTAFLERKEAIGVQLARIPPTLRLWDSEASILWNDLAELFRCCLAPGLRPARVTKVLHKKRPNLIPILDSVIVHYLKRTAAKKGIALPNDEAERMVSYVKLLRTDVERNLPTLQHLGKRVAALGGELSPLRVLDIVIWGWSREYQPIRRRTQA
jgi:cyclic pyranopterin phosphate synthase